MMDIVTGCSGESPLGFRANPQIRGAVRRPCRRTTASKHNGIAQSKTMAMRRRRIHAECAVITAVISTASSVVPVTTWLRSEWAHAAASEPMHQVTAGMQNGAHCANDLWAQPPTLTVIATPAAWQKSAAGGAFAVEHHGQGQLESSQPGTVLTALIRPAPSGEITPDPPQVPAPTVKPIAPSVAAPPPQAEQPLSPPRPAHGTATPTRGTRTTTRGTRTTTRGTRTTTGGASFRASAAGPCPARTVRQ